ncbi:MAG: GHMP kinase [Chloroflexota bacterium]
MGCATVLAPGTCGELVQGFLDGTHFLVTCPVNLYSRVSVALCEGEPGIKGPRNCPKSAEAVRATLAHLGRERLGAELTVESTLPRGKGMASSTADVAGAVAATALALGTTLSPAEIARLAISVEPSDGIMFPGIALFDHRQGSLHRELGPAPPVDIVALDFGGSVDTVEFNKIDRKAMLCECEGELREALELVHQGIASRDPSLVGRGASISALLNQRVLYRRQLDRVIAFGDSVGAVGVNVAHSGTVIGVLIDRRTGNGAAILEQARGIFPELEASYCLKLIGGGLEHSGESHDISAGCQGA